MFERPASSPANPNPEAPIETAAKSVAPLLPPPFGSLLALAVGSLVSGATIVVAAKSETKKVS